MNIGEAARQSGLTAKMIRHYEAEGLIQPAGRSGSGYRQYSQRDIATLQFIRRARVLDFSLPQIAGLLQLWQNPGRASKEVRALALEHLQTLEARLAELQAMKTQLEEMVRDCPGDDAPHCSILDGLGSAQGKA